jgi:NAD(P)-dependent dehydrogenase (short-subunit alcohol dehydrogenase family)
MNRFGVFCALLALLPVIACSTQGDAMKHDDQSAPTVLITGSNRGIGLEFARQYAEAGWRVIATCRSPARADELKAIADEYPRVTIESLDIADAVSVRKLAETYRDVAIDVLLNNAALLGEPGPQVYPDIDFELFEHIVLTNTVGTTRVVAAFSEHVAASSQKKIVILGSAAGSISQVSAAPNSYLPYRASKAGLHLIARNLSLHLADKGIAVGLINPGLVDTRGILDLKPGDPVPEQFKPVMPLIEQGIIQLQTTQEAVADMRIRVDELSVDEAGRFINYDGREMPW